jgi:hypothetical protein
VWEPPDPWAVPAFADLFTDGAERYARRCHGAVVASETPDTDHGRALAASLPPVGD